MDDVFCVQFFPNIIHISLTKFFILFVQVDSEDIEYSVIGKESCMGDHKVISFAQKFL